MTPQERYHATRRAVRAAWIERRDSLGYKGKKADDYALEFIVGVRCGMLLERNPAWPCDEDARTAIDFLVFDVSIRGQLGLLSSED